MKEQAGFTLIEMIASLVLVGILAVFSGMFLTKAIEGYVFSQQNSEAALKAQIAVDRIGLELRDINSIISLVQDSSISYTSDVLPGTRIFKFNSGNIFITVDGADNILLDNVSNFTLAATTDDLDGVSGDEVAHIDVGFTLTISEIPTNFDTQIYLRNMLPAP